MLYCDRCGRENGWPISLAFGDVGRCEVCGYLNRCSDVPYRYLAPQKERMMIEQFGPWFDQLDERQQKEVRFCFRCERATYGVREFRRLAVIELATFLTHPPTLAWREAMPRYVYQVVALAEDYAVNYAHGTDGHNSYMLIAKLAGLLDAQEKSREQTPST